MDDVSCPRCKTTKFRNPSLKLMVNQCGHPLCEKCVEILFIKGSGNCPSCNILLRKQGYRLQVFDDPLVEKELDIRKKVLKDMNAREEDFPSLSEYNDYLEMVEDIIFKMTNNVDIEATKRRIEQYKKDNKTMINRNRGRQTKDDLLIERLLEEEKIVAEYRSEQQKKEEMERRKAKLKQKEDLIDELASSEMSAAQIVAMHEKHKQDQLDLLKEEEKARPAPTTAFSTGIKVGLAGSGGPMEDGGGFLPVPKAAEPPPYEYRPLLIEPLGPEAPNNEQLDDYGYLNHVRESAPSELAGGFESKVACQRALQSAFCGLYFEIETV